MTTLLSFCAEVAMRCGLALVSLVAFLSTSPAEFSVVHGPAFASKVAVSMAAVATDCPFTLLNPAVDQPYFNSLLSCQRDGCRFI